MRKTSDPVGDAANRHADQELKRLNIEKRWEYRSERVDALYVILGALIAGVVIIVISYMVWIGTRGLNSSQQMEREARQECMEIKGTFIPNGNLCIGPSHQLEKP